MTTIVIQLKHCQIQIWYFGYFYLCYHIKSINWMWQIPSNLKFTLYLNLNTLHFNSGIILTAEVLYMHRIIKNNESSILPLFQLYYSQNFTNVILLSSLDFSCLSGCLSRNRKNLELAHLFIQFWNGKTINSFLRKEWQIISNFLYPYLILSENLLPICHLNPLSYLRIFLPKA